MHQDHKNGTTSILLIYDKSE